ncbi:MAG: hypothetical protein WC889_07985, partial [Myxococcota bacterium]
MTRLLIFMWGVVTAAGQMLLLRGYVCAAGGNELVLGLFFASWLTGVAGGAMGGGVLARRTRWSVQAAACVLVWPVVCVSSVVLLACSAAVVRLDPGLVPSLGQCAVLALLGVFPAAFVSGLFFPAAVVAVKGGAGEAYWLDGAGMAAGSVLAVFLIQPFMGEVGGVALCSSFLFFVAAVNRGLRSRSGAAVLVAGAALLALVLSGAASDADRSLAAKRFELARTGFHHVAGANTRYARYDIGAREGEKALFMNGAFAATFPDPYTVAPGAALLLTEAAMPQRVLVIGAASFELAAALLKGGAKSVELVETDRELAGLLGDNIKHLIPDDPGLRVYYTDGRRYMKDAPAGRYGLIVADLPEPSTAAFNRYYTREFYTLAGAALAPGGVFAARMPVNPAIQGLQNIQAASVYKALKMVFQDVLPTSGMRSWILASMKAGGLTDDTAMLDKRGVTAGMAPGLVSEFIEVGGQGRIADGLAGSPAIPNTDMRPVAYRYNLALWGMTASSAAMEKNGLLFGAVVAVCMIIFLIRRRGPAAVSAAAAVSGAAGISAELMCILSFQNGQGALYSQIGVLCGAYMAGMT